MRLAYVNNNFSGSVRFTNESGIITTTIPEPATLALLGLGVIGMMALRRRRR